MVGMKAKSKQMGQLPHLFLLFYKREAVGLNGI
jgi:hypothetical protein